MDSGMAVGRDFVRNRNISKPKRRNVNIEGRGEIRRISDTNINVIK
jgi:hypothetical protein